MKTRASNRRVGSRSTALWVVALAVLAAVSSVAAKPVQLEFDIRAQSLSSALIEFGDQADVTVGVADGTPMDRVDTEGVLGTYTVDQAMTELLSGTELEHVWSEDSSIVVRPQAPEPAEPQSEPQEKVDPTPEQPEPEDRVQSEAATERPRFTGDVTVTATKREVNVREVPASVSVFAGGDLETLGAARNEDYILEAPGVNYNKYEPERSEISMRGISTTMLSQNTQVTVGTYVDLNPFDLERVELLRGPQGTLYGSASLGGVMRYVTNKPKLDRNEGALHLTTTSVADGGVNLLTQGMFNAVVSEGKFAVRGVLAYNQDDGYIDNHATPGGTTENWNSFDQLSGRLIATWAPSDKVRFDASYIRQDLARDGNNQLDGRFDPDFNDPSQLTWRQASAENVTDIGNLTLSFDLGFGELTSSTSYLDKNQEQNIEFGELFVFDAVSVEEWMLMEFMGLPIEFGDLSSQVTWRPVLGTADSESFFQEFRLVSRDTGTFDWIVGAYYADVTSEFQTEVWLEGMEDAVNAVEPGVGTMLYPDDLYVSFPGSQDASEWAVYGELGIDLSEVWKLNLGGRYFAFESETYASSTSWGWTDGVGPLPADESDFMPKVSLAYRPGNDLLWYALASRGYRVGGANEIVALYGGSAPLTYETDKLWNYETGVKKTWANGKVITDVALFYLDWSDIQLPVTFLDPSSPWGMTSAILNTGSAHSLGVEAFFSAQLAQGLMFVISIAWTEAELDEDTMPIMNGETGEFVVVPAGTRLPGTPDWNISSMLQYYFNSPKLGFPFIELSHVYKGEVTDEISVQGIVPSWNLFNFRVGATIAKDLQVSLAVNNLLDDRQPMARWYAYMGSFVPYVQPEMWYIMRPRSVSLTLQMNF